MKILITGATNGMGKGAAKVLAGYGNKENEIIILCRNRALGEKTISEIKEETLNGKLSLIICDLSRLADVQKAVETIRASHDFLDAIFVNAGIGYAADHTETADGMDAHFQVNYLSQFILVIKLLGLLERSAKGARVVFNVIEHGKIYWDDLQLKENWTYLKALLQSMLAKRLLIRKLHQVYNRRENPEISFIGFEIPKTVWTNQVTIIPAGMRIMARVMKFFGKFISIEQCGELIAPLFMDSPEETLKKSGKFLTWQNGNFTEIPDDRNIVNQEAIDRLWNTSLKLCADKETVELAKKLELRLQPELLQK